MPPSSASNNPSSRGAQGKKAPPPPAGPKSWKCPNCLKRIEVDKARSRSASKNARGLRCAGSGYQLPEKCRCHGLPRGRKFRGAVVSGDRCTSRSLTHSVTAVRTINFVTAARVVTPSVIVRNGRNWTVIDAAVPPPSGRRDRRFAAPSRRRSACRDAM